MKKTYFIVLLILASNYVNAQYTAILDANFEQELIDDGIDSEGVLDGQILTSDAAVTETLILTGTFKPNSSKIFDLTGIEAFTALRVLRCEGNLLTIINLSQNSLLEELQCQINNLSNLDLTNNEQLTLLYCNNNSLTSLNTSNNTSLLKIRCQSNSITALDVTNLSGLTELRCQNNDLQPSIDLSQNSLLTTFTSTSNPNLLCIEVSDASAANNGSGIYALWTKDSGASFSEDCNPTLSTNEFPLYSDIKIYPNPVISRVNFEVPNNIVIDSIIIYNLQGKMVLQTKNINNINIESLNKGIYLLKMLGDDFSLIKRIIK